MDYEKYFDSLMDKDLYPEKDEILSILKNEFDNPSVKNYNELDEMVFEFVLSLKEKGDYDTIIELKTTLERHYKEVHDAEYGQFTDVLIPYFISINKDKEAKLLFDEWIKKDYDYDHILILINRLAHYGKESWIEEFITKEYDAIKKSPKLITGAEMDLVVYKIMIEIGKFNSGTRQMNEIIEELANYKLEIKESHQKILEDSTLVVDFNQNKTSHIVKTINDFQIHLNTKYDIPYIESGIVMNTLIAYYEGKKYNNLTTYFKIHKNSFERYMSENSVNGLALNVESNFAMLYYLPILYQFLLAKKIFKASDVREENKKVEWLLKIGKRKYKGGSWVLDGLKSYQTLKAAKRI